MAKKKQRRNKSQPAAKNVPAPGKQTNTSAAALASSPITAPRRQLLPVQPAARRALLWKLGVAIVILLASQAALWAIRQELALTPASLSGVSLREWPLRLGSWRGERTSLSAEVVRHSGADAMGTWLYQNQLGEQVVVHAGIWRKYETSLPHPPELCYAGSGYRLLESGEIAIPAPQRTPAHGMLYRFERHGQPLMVLAWYQFGDETILNRDELRGLMQRVRVGSGVLPPAVKVMLQCRAEDPARAEQRLLDIASLLRVQAAPLQSAE